MTRPNNMFAQGITLSKNYDSRDLDATKILYALFQEAVLIAQLEEGSPRENRKREEALTFLTTAFTPLVNSVAYMIYEEHKSTQELADVTQDTYMAYLLLINKYDPTKSSFAYYIKNNLERFMKTYAKRFYKSNITLVEDSELEELLNKHSFKSSSQVFDEFDELILYKEYEEFMQESAEKKSKTDTHKVVCKRYFLGNEDMQDIAEDLDVSYQAIYQITRRVKKELEYFFHYTKFSEYTKDNNLVRKGKQDANK